MAGLLEKDLQLILQRKQTLLLFVAVSVVMGISTSGSFIVGYMALLGTILALGTIAYDDADNGMPFLMTLPVSRGSYVRAKYLFILLTGLAAWVLGLALMFLMAALRGIRPDVPQELVSAAGVLPALLVMMDLLVPLQLKYGPEKSRLALIVIFGLVAAVSFALSGSREDALAGLLEAIGRIPSALLLGAGFAAAVLLTVLSLVISTRVMNKKEF